MWTSHLTTSLALLFVSPCLINAFVVRPGRVAILPAKACHDNPLKCPSPLRMSGDSEETPAAPKRKRRRKRKVAEETNDAVAEVEEEEVAPEPAAAPVIELKPREDKPVELKVQDVREVLGVAPVSASSTSTPPAPTSTSSSSSSSSETSPISSSSTSNPLDDSMEQLLADARRMREEENEVVEEEGSGSIKATIGKTLSTIVTVDFFIVMAFLAWFLLGIFCSSILKNDFVQIAFNNNFETLVQPALGVLMLGTIAGNFFKEDEENVQG